MVAEKRLIEINENLNQIEVTSLPDLKRDIDEEESNLLLSERRLRELLQSVPQAETLLTEATNTRDNFAQLLS